MIISKNQYLRGFGITVIVLALVRCAFPSIAGSLNEKEAESASQQLSSDTCNVAGEAKSVAGEAKNVAGEAKSKAGEAKSKAGEKSIAAEPKRLDGGSNDAAGEEKSKVGETASSYDGKRPLPRKDYAMADVAGGAWHRVSGVRGFSQTFCDSNDVQYASAIRLGVSAVRDRAEAEERKAELVYMAASPYYHVDPLKQSIPYLVPRAAVLLSDIGRHFFDSLYVKHLPLHQLIVTSVLRSQQDLEQLKQRNRNTSDNSCHLFGTTIDISYNRYHPVSDPLGKPCRKVGGDTLKWVLAEVLRDLRAEERCYVKYEVKQGCFHITVR